MPTVVAAKRYAKALFELALEQKVLDAVQADLEELGGLLKRADELQALTAPFVITIEGRKRNIRAVFEGRLHPLALRFLLFLAEKRRFEMLPGIVEEFQALYDAHMDILPLRVVSARALEPAQVAEITRRMEARFRKKVRASFRVDPSLLGGFRVLVGDVVYDYSIEHLLGTLHRKLITA